MFKKIYKSKIPVISLIVIALVIPLIIFLAFASDNEKPGGLEIGTIAPQIAGETLSGDFISLTELRTDNQWVVLNFFASWCIPCIKEHQEFVNIKVESPYPVEILSVQFNEAESKGRDFFEKYGGDWPVLISNNIARRVALEYRILTVPETYLIAPNGIVAAHWRGEITAETVIERMEAIVNAN